MITIEDISFITAAFLTMAITIGTPFAAFAYYYRVFCASAGVE